MGPSNEHSSGHRNNFDLLRLFAACQVMFSHAWNWLHLGDSLNGTVAFNLLFSTPGVAIFFVISGFLVTDSYIRSSSAASFFVKRSLRIFPALFVNIAMMELALRVTGGLNVSGILQYLSYFTVYILTAARIWAVYFTYEPYTMSGFYGVSDPSGVLWTLTVELTFYLTLPTLLEIWRRWKRAGTLVVAVAALGSWVMAQHFNITDRYNPFLSVTVGPTFWIFSMGVLARLYWHRVSRIFEGKLLWWLATHLAITWWVAGTSAAFISINNAAPVDAFRIAILAGLVLSAAYSVPRPSLLRGQDLSYGIYLYHMLVMHTLIGIGWVGHWWLWIVEPVGTVVIAALSWALIEKPAMKLRASLVARRLSVA
ncbi:nodulation protein NodX [Rhizobium aegyptiacum]|uniref:nodulation protein NodX n=1 Tax=Rhizobium aegyptiacum TaxID=1764550 RepID=UPI0007E53183|nr:nodulation protein NodX [Rhizobium aegyptiacum]